MYMEQQRNDAYWAQWRGEYPWNRRTERRMNLVVIAILPTASFIAMLFM